MYSSSVSAIEKREGIVRIEFTSREDITMTLAAAEKLYSLLYRMNLDPDEDRVYE